MVYLSIFQCTSNEVSLCQYRLNYEFVHDQIDESVEALKKQQTLLIEASVRLSRFSTKNLGRFDDPFFGGLTRMIREEEFSSQRHKSSRCNQRLTADLKALRSEYEQQINNTCSSTTNESLSSIYELILSLQGIPTIRKQIDAIKAYQRLFLSSNERNADRQTAQP